MAWVQGYFLSYLDSRYWLAGPVCWPVELSLELLQGSHRLLVGSYSLLLLKEVGTKLRQSLEGGREGGMGGREGGREGRA